MTKLVRYSARVLSSLMLHSWFGSKSSRHSQPRQTRPNLPPGPENAQLGHSDASSLSQSTVGPLRTPGNLTSASDIPLDEVHTHINDPSLYATTPSLIHSAEKEAVTLRTPEPPATSLDAATYKRGSAQRASAPEGTLFTPQDAIVAQVFGRSVLPSTDSAHATPPPPSSAPRPSVSQTSDSLPLPPSTQTPPASSVQGPTLPLYDPFSGAKLGERTPMSPSVTIPGELSSFAPIPTVDDRKLWSSLERILELQAEIAAMHADMEGVGGRASGNNHAGIASVGASEGGNIRPRKRSKRGQTLPVGDEEPEEHEPEASTGAAISEISTEHSEAEEEDEDEEDEDDIHGYGKKRRDEEFARLAEQFAQRKAAIGGIMNKVCMLESVAGSCLMTMAFPSDPTARRPLDGSEDFPYAPSSTL